MELYRRFKEIVPSKAEEKKIDKEFQEVSGYSIYRAIQRAKEIEEQKACENVKNILKNKN